MGDAVTSIALTYGTKIVDAELKTAALTELLIDKGVFTRVEFEEKYELVNKRDFKELKADLAKLLIEYGDMLKEKDKS